MKLTPVQRLVRQLPRALLSRITGRLVRLRLPGVLSRKLLRLYVAKSGIDMSEALNPLSSFGTIEEVFTRLLKPGARPVSGNVCSPSDGTLTLCEPVENDTTLQAKGVSYSVSELITGGRYSMEFKPARSLTTYLSPRDYHRVHVPASGELVRIAYFPGDLWPVNDRFIHLVPRLFVKNERLVFHFKLDGGGVMALVMVGALNVGRMVTPFAPDLITNASAARETVGHQLSVSVKQGEELGTFMLGSTVVMVFDEEACKRLNFTAQTGPIKLGQAIAERI